MNATDSTTILANVSAKDIEEFVRDGYGTCADMTRKTLKGRIDPSEVLLLIARFELALDMLAEREKG